MDRVTFGKKNSNTNRPRVDRFIPPRGTFNGMRRRHSWSEDCDMCTNNLDIWYTKYLQRKKYAVYLDEAFGVETAPMHDPKLPQESCWTWPCIPRKKSYLSSADSILDLPSYSYAIFPEVLDWSNENLLVAALGSNYHKWSWKGQTLISQGVTPYNIQCCKFDPRGDLLALGTETGTLDIHDNDRNKKITGSYCRCSSGTLPSCSVTTLDWSSTGNSCVIGCSMGAITSFNRDAELINWRRLFNKPVLTVRVSPNARYVATSSMDTSSVMVLTWPSLELCSSLDSFWTIRAITWHPWRSAFLGVGSVTSDHQAQIALWNTPTGTVRVAALSCKRYSLDTMLFSHRTGEMVVSLWNADRAISHPKTSQLVVLSDPETVVDQWGEGRAGLDRVRTMVFSPDGTKLATATSDEDLIIWNFLPEDRERRKKKGNRFSALPVYLDKAERGFSLR